MLQTKLTIFELLNPCRLAENQRQQAVIESQSSNYIENGDIIFVLPATECLDMTQSYVDAFIQLTNITAEVATEYTLDLTGVTAGSYRFTYAGSASSIIQWDATGPEIQTALESMQTIGGRYYDVSVDATAAPVFVLSFSGSEITFGENNDLGLTQVTQLQNLTPVIPLFLSTPGEPAFPRLDLFSPVIQQVKIDIDSTNFVNITDAAILSNIIRYMDGVNEFFGRTYFNNQHPTGFFATGQFRIEINLDFIGFLKHIIPLNVMSKIIRITLKCQQNAFCLQQKTSLSNGGYQLVQPRLHYHLVSLPDDETALLRSTYETEGLLLPYQNWYPYSQNLSAGTANQNIMFNPSLSNLLGVLFCFVPVDWSLDKTNPQKLSVFLRNGIQQYRLKIGSIYYPLDNVESDSGLFSDLSQQIQNLEMMMQNVNHIDNRTAFDRLCYMNFDGSPTMGNLPEYTSHNFIFDDDRRNSWIGGISTCTSAADRYGFVCPKEALAGVNTSRQANCTLELKNLSLTQDNTIYIWSLGQEYMLVKPGEKVEIYK